jgi:regulatory protein
MVVLHLVFACSPFYLYISVSMSDYIDPKIETKIKHYCAYQERCHSEVRYKLLSWRIRGQLIEEMLAMLVEENYLNEERYARAIVRGKFQYKQWGKRKISLFLKHKDISENCIKLAMQEIDEDVYSETILKIILKKIEEYSPCASFEMRQKITQYLSQKGFESYLIQQIINENIQWKEE